MTVGRQTPAKRLEYISDEDLGQKKIMTVGRQTPTKRLEYILHADPGQFFFMNGWAINSNKGVGDCFQPQNKCNPLNGWFGNKLQQGGWSLFPTSTQVQFFRDTQVHDPPTTTYVLLRAVLSLVAHSHAWCNT
jgi:hypothetical protein